MRHIDRGNGFVWLLGLFVLAISMAGCTVSPKPIVGIDLPEREGRTFRLVLLPPDISVNEISVGGVVEEDPRWTGQAKEAVGRAVRDFFSGGGKTTIEPMPELSPDEKAVVHEHLLLYDVVAAHAHLATRMPAMGWKHKVENFDYSIGGGLRFLKEKSGADCGIFIIGADYISSGGRKTMVAIAALAGIAMPVGSSHLQAGIVDLESGAVLWFNNLQALANRDLRDFEDSRQMVGEMFEDF